jgi:hypothetical protein
MALKKGRGLAKPNDAADLLDGPALVFRLKSCGDRARGVFELNEFTSEVSRQLLVGSRVPVALGRACFASAALFAALALAHGLGAGPSALVVTPALVAAGVGLAGGLVCLQIGRVARLRRQALRDAARSLRVELERLLPAESATGN